MPTQLEIECANEQALLVVDETRLRKAAELILRDAGIRQGTLSIAVVDDAAIHRLNYEFLRHDYPTDVLSFALEEGVDSFEGEVIVSAETSIRNAQEIGWSAVDELLLYVIHGTLHLIGHRDKSEEEREEMRRAEMKYLGLCDVELPSLGGGAECFAIKGE